MANYNSIRGGEKIGSRFREDVWPISFTNAINRRSNLARPRELVIVCADAEQYQPVADRAGGRLLRGDAADLSAGRASSIARLPATRPTRSTSNRTARCGRCSRSCGTKATGSLAWSRRAIRQNLHQLSICAAHGAGDRQ